MSWAPQLSAGSLSGQECMMKKLFVIFLGVMCISCITTFGQTMEFDLPGLLGHYSDSVYARTDTFTYVGGPAAERTGGPLAMRRRKNCLGEGATSGPPVRSAAERQGRYTARKRVMFVVLLERSMK